MRVLAMAFVALFLVTGALPANAASPAAYEYAREIVKDGPWTIRDIMRPRILGTLGRLEILIENGTGERRLLKLSQRDETISTLNTGDLITFTLAPVIKKGWYTFPAFELEGGHKAPNPYLLDPGSYLIPHRLR